jgi:eukaryotic-like serine/threonine-protein kinase
VTDLGISRIWEDGPDGGPISVAGTPHYMAPEKLGGKRRESMLMTRADVYSAGVIAYELLTGGVPFDDDHAGNVMRQQIYRAPDRPSIRRPGLSRLYDGPILRALAKDPAERFSSVAAFWVALSAAHEEARDFPPVERILLVDDDCDFRELAAGLLHKAFPAAEIVHCADGETGLAALDGGRFELAVIDLDLPGMNGLELAASIRAQPRAPTLPILVVTGRGGAGDWRVLSHLGATGFLVKPLEPSAFIQTATRMLSKS